MLRVILGLVIALFVIPVKADVSDQWVDWKTERSSSIKQTKSNGESLRITCEEGVGWIRYQSLHWFGLSSTTFHSGAPIEIFIRRGQAVYAFSGESMNFTGPDGVKRFKVLWDEINRADEITVVAAGEEVAYFTGSPKGLLGNFKTNPFCPTLK